MLIGNKSMQPYSPHPAFARQQTQKVPYQMTPSCGSTSTLPSSTCGICQKNFNTEINLPKRLPCGHSFCLFCLTVQENKTLPYINIECPCCLSQYRGIPAAQFETDLELLQILEKINQSIGQTQNQYIIGGSYGTPIQQNYSSYFQTPQRPQQSPFQAQNCSLENAQQNSSPYDINQVTQIFENMRVNTLNKTPQTKVIKGKVLHDFDTSLQSSPMYKEYHTRQQLNASKVKDQPLLSAATQSEAIVCAREGCHNPRAVHDSQYRAQYCSKACEFTCKNKGMLYKNQDAIYREVARQKSRSKSPNKLLRTFQQYSPLKGSSNQQRSKSPLSRTEAQGVKKSSIFSDTQSDRISYTPYQPAFNSDQFKGVDDSMIRRLNFETPRRKPQLQSKVQTHLGVFGESALDKFMQEKAREQSSLMSTPQSTAFTQYAGTSPGIFSQRAQPYPTHNENFIRDHRLQIALAPNDPAKCINPQCSNRKFLLEGTYLPVCSRSCSQNMNITFP